MSSPDIPFAVRNLSDELSSLSTWDKAPSKGAAVFGSTNTCGKRIWGLIIEQTLIWQFEKTTNFGEVWRTVLLGPEPADTLSLSNNLITYVGDVEHVEQVSTRRAQIGNRLSSTYYGEPARMMESVGFHSIETDEIVDESEDFGYESDVGGQKIVQRRDIVEPVHAKESTNIGEGSPVEDEEANLGYMGSAPASQQEGVAIEHSENCDEGQDNNIEAAGGSQLGAEEEQYSEGLQQGEEQEQREGELPNEEGADSISGDECEISAFGLVARATEAGEDQGWDGMAIGRLIVLIAQTLGWDRQISRLHTFLRQATLPSFSSIFVQALNEQLIWLQAKEAIELAGDMEADSTILIDLFHSLLVHQPLEFQQCDTADQLVRTCVTHPALNEAGKALDILKELVEAAGDPAIKQAIVLAIQRGDSEMRSRFFELLPSALELAVEELGKGAAVGDEGETLEMEVDQEHRQQQEEQVSPNENHKGPEGAIGEDLGKGEVGQGSVTVEVVEMEDGSEGELAEGRKREYSEEVQEEQGGEAEARSPYEVDREGEDVESEEAGGYEVEAAGEAELRERELGEDEGGETEETEQEVAESEEAGLVEDKGAEHNGEEAADATGEVGVEEEAEQAPENEVEGEERTSILDGEEEAEGGAGVQLDGEMEEGDEDAGLEGGGTDAADDDQWEGEGEQETEGGIVRKWRDVDSEGLANGLEDTAEDGPPSKRSRQGDKEVDQDDPLPAEGEG